MVMEDKGGYQQCDIQFASLGRVIAIMQRHAQQRSTMENKIRQGAKTFNL